MITTFERERVLMTFRGNALCEVDNPRQPGARMYVACNRRGFTDYPMVHEGWVYWGNPEQFTAQFRHKAKVNLLSGK